MPASRLAVRIHSPRFMLKNDHFTSAVEKWPMSTVQVAAGEKGVIVNSPAGNIGDTIDEG